MMGRSRRHSVEGSAPLIIPTAEPTTSGLSDKHKKMFKWATIFLLSVLLSGGALAAILITTVFNSCPHQYSTDTGIVTCDNTTASPRHGTQCNMTCKAGYISSGVLHSTCGWLGKWSSPPLTCTTPGVLVAGYTYQGQSKKASSEIYPSSYRDPDYQALPTMLDGAVSGYIGGTPMVCGGLDLEKKPHKIKADCQTLTQDNTWTTSTPLLKERYFASSAIVNDGKTLWILGGVDDTKYIQSNTMVLHDHNPSQWIQGPEMLSPRLGHCSTNVRSTSVVMVTGGYNSTHSLSLVEMYDWKSETWTTFTPLNEARQGHACAQVFTDQEGSVDLFPTQHSLLTVVVAGGYSRTHNSSIQSPVTSVELLVGDQWTFLPPLPKLHFGLMTLPTALAWMPGLGLQLVGGCWMNYTDQTCQCSQLAWSLQSTILEPEAKWVAKLGQKLDEMMMPGNTALLIPNNFLRVEKPSPTTTQVPDQTPTTSTTKLNDLKIPDSTKINNITFDENPPITNNEFEELTYEVLPGPEFDNKWLVPIKMPLFMRRFMDLKPMYDDDDDDNDNNFGHFAEEDMLRNEDN